MTFSVAYQTDLGIAYVGDCLEVLPNIPARSVDLVVTSPPYGLHFQKEYGNVPAEKYVEWFLPFAKEIKRVLKDTGSFVLNVGGSWAPGSPVRTLYPYKLLVALCEEVGFYLAQEFFWYNPARLPSPAEWVNVRRIRVKDAVEFVFWLSVTPFPKADNRNILQPYSRDMMRLIRRGVRATVRPSGHRITAKFTNAGGGSIPPNIIIAGNNDSNSAYIRLSRALKQDVHPARFPLELPRFFIMFLTEPGDLVLDPFAGSNTTGAVAESLGRRWIAIEINPKYVENSKVRFLSLTEHQLAPMQKTLWDA